MIIVRESDNLMVDIFETVAEFKTHIHSKYLEMYKELVAMGEEIRKESEFGPRYQYYFVWTGRKVEFI